MIELKYREKMEQDPRVLQQIELEKLYNKNQLLSRIYTEFEKSGVGEYIEQQGIDADFGISLLVQMSLHKRTTLPILVSILRGHMEGDCQKTADMLLKCAQADLVDWNALTEQFIIKHDITADVKDELEMFQFPLPMVVAPRTLRSNRDSAYHGVKDGSIILRKNHHDDDVCLDHINRVNGIKFSLDTQTARMIGNSWRNLDKPKPGETRQDFDRRKRAFDKYDRTAKRVMGQVTRLGNEFYLTHKYDKRGRTYCQGYHINYQGAAWNKAVVQLADKEIIP